MKRRECAVTPLSPRHSQHELANPQGGVAVTAGANDSVAIVVGSAAIALYRISSPVLVADIDFAGELLDCLG